MSLKKKAYSGLFWSLFQLFGIQGLNFLLSILMARLLLPEDYGILGLLAVFMAVGNTLINSGMTASLIRSIDPQDEDYSTVFWLNLGVSALIYMVLYFSAPWIADFFKQPILVLITRVYCLSLIFGALSMVQRARLTKQMDFRTQMLVSVPALVLAGGLGIYLALDGKGVWALVGMNLAQIFLNSVFFWIHSGWMPLWMVRGDLIRSHLGFGYKLTLANLLESVFRHSYQVVIGKFFPIAQLGYYAKAENLKQIPVQNISSAIDSVTFPLFSKIQDEDDRLRKAYRVVMQQILFLLAPILTFSSILAVPIFRLILTEKWVPAAPYFQILSVIGILYPLHSYNINILKIKGRSDLILVLEILKKIPLIFGLYLAVSRDIFFLLYLQVGLNIISYFLNTAYSGKMIGYSILDQIKDLLPNLLPLGISGLFVYFFYQNFNTWADFTVICSGFLVGFSVYFLVSISIQLEPLMFLKKEFLRK